MAQNLILRKFSVSRDFRSVAWKETLWYNLLRSLGAGVVFSTIALLLRMEPGIVLVQVVGHPILWLVFGLPLGSLAAKLASAVPGMSLLAAIIALVLVTLGDPLVSLLRLLVPRAVPIEDPPLFDLSLLILLLRPESTKEITIAHEAALRNP